MLSPGHDLKLSAHLLLTIMTKSYDSLDELIEDKAREAEAEKIVARSQAQRERDEHSWRCGYDYMHEGALGDF